MAGIENTTLFSSGERLQPSSANDISRMQEESTDVSRINYSGNPEGNVSANPSSLCHNPVSGNIYQKMSGTGNTGWELIGTVGDLNPFKNILLVDDFFPNTATPDPNTNIPPLGQLGWVTNTFIYNNGTANNPGLAVQNSSSQVNPYLLFMGFNDNKLGFKVGGGQQTLNFVQDLVGLSVLGNRYIFKAGLFDDGVTPNNGIYLSYSDNVNSGNWVLTCLSGGVATSVNTSTPATTGFVNLGIIINDLGTSVSFTINEVSVGTPITTNIPSANLAAGFLQTKSSGFLPLMEVDLFVFQKTLTTSR